MSSKIRNIGIIAHINAGKTTTTESILFYTGREKRLGSVQDGTSITDYLEEEIQRGISIRSAYVTCSWQGYEIHLMDTPGHIDFTGEVEKILGILDGAIVLFSANEGVQSQTEGVWKQADRYQLPRIAFINKMDRLGANLPETLKSIEQSFRRVPILLQLPLFKEGKWSGLIDLISLRFWDFSLPVLNPTRYKPGTIPAMYQEEVDFAREEMIETMAVHLSSLSLETLLNLYFEGKPIPPELLWSALKEGVLQNQMLPVFCGVALKNQGTASLLDGVISLLPGPEERKPIEGYSQRLQKFIPILAQVNEPFCGLVFKIVADPQEGFIFLIRIYRGRLHSGTTVWNVCVEKPEQITRIWSIYAGEKEERREAEAGEVIGVSGLQWTSTGETLCAREEPILLEKKKFAEPVISLVIEPQNEENRPRLKQILTQFAKEDPTLRYSVDENTAQDVFSGMGELHLEVYIQRLQRETKIAVNHGNPRVLYKESIVRKSRGEGFVRKTISDCETLHEGHMLLELVPNAQQEEVVWKNFLSKEVESFPYWQAIQEGLESVIQSGGQQGHPLCQMEVHLLSAERHPHDTEIGYQTAVQIAFKQALKEAGSILFEPL
ncbi:MAG: GTP-binding protein, partial [Planctomycetota bacterium]